jgi:hypothetical protein
MDTLFHYTNAAGLLGILGNSCIWASDVRFLNDAQETKYGYDELASVLATVTNPASHEGHRLHGTNWEAQFAEHWDYFRQMLLGNLAMPSGGVYVCCFCEEGDLLSQWRAYGSDHGYAIEIKATALTASIAGSLPGSRLVPVRYGHDAAADVIREASNWAASYDDAGHPGIRAHYAAMELTAMLAQIKHPGFAEEREWRLVVANESRSDNDERRTQFRASAMAIVPYIALPLEPEAIVSVRVGPGNNLDVRESGLQALLVSIGRSVPVHRSEVPLRA